MKLLGLVLFLLPSLAWGYTDTQVQQMVGGKLLERTPTDTAAWWQSLGDNAASVVIGMYGAETNNFHRARLIQGLGWIDSPQAVDFIKQQAQDTDLDTLRNAAIRAVARGEGAKEEDWVAKWLKNDDPQTRLAAAESLRDMKDARAKDLYSAYLKEEKTPWLVDKLNGKNPTVGSLKPVASSDDRLSPDFTGTWRGYWMAPNPKGKGMQSSPVVLDLKPVTDAGVLSGKLTVLNHGSVAHSFDVSQGSGKSIRIAGTFVEQVVKQGLQFPFEGSLTRMGETELLEMRIPSKSSVMVLKKD